MSTVGIMSMQRILNYGSSLQAYALGRILEGISDDVRVSFVDYRPGEPDRSVATGNALTAPVTSALRKAKEYGRNRPSVAGMLGFVNHKRNYARNYFPMLGLPAGPNLDLDLDLQVIGSDEVFNCLQPNTRIGYSRDLFGHGSPARSVVSYAASFGNTTWSRIQAAGVAGTLREDLSRFDAISVRDPNSAEIVTRLTGTEPQIHVDPVLAYDYMRLEPGIPASRVEPRDYLLVYGYPGRLTRDENREIVGFARRNSLEILCIGGMQGACDRFVDPDPFEVLAYFRDASAVVTDTFHGSIMAMINRVPFATIVRQSTGRHYGNEQKLGHLLRAFGLQSQRISTPHALSATLEQSPDFRTLELTLVRERERSVDYLTDVTSMRHTR